MIHTEFMNKRQLAAHNKMVARVKELNVKFEVGETVKVRNDFGDYDSDKIRYQFSIMSGQVVAWLTVKGSYLAERVEKEDK